MEDKVRRNIIIPATVDEKLKREHNASAVIVEALEKHYAAKDAAKQLIGLQEETRSALNGLDSDVDKSYRLLKKIALAMRNSGADIDV